MPFLFSVDNNVSRRRHFPQFSSILIYASQVGTLYVVLNYFIKDRSRRRHFPQFSSILIYASQVGTLYVVLNYFIKDRSRRRHFPQFNRKIMIKSAEWEHFPPQRPLPSAKPPPSPKGKAMTSSVSNADTFPEREGIFAEWEHFLPFRFSCFDLKTKGELPAA